MRNSNSHMYGVVPVANDFCFVDVFGYSTNGIPGLTITGAKDYKTIREKFIYLTKKSGLRLPMKRFSLCVQGIPKASKTYPVDESSIEIPLLITFWHLAGLVSIQSLSSCFASGVVSINGKIKDTELSKSFLKRVDDKAVMSRKRVIYINSGITPHSQKIEVIPTYELLSNLGRLD